MDTPGYLVKQALAHNGWDQRTLAIVCGWSESKVSRLLTDQELICCVPTAKTAMDAQTMTEAEIIQRAKQTFVLDTPTERLARELIGVAERSTRQRDELQGLLTPLRDAVLFARSQRRPMGIGQDFPRAPACVRIELGPEYGCERDCVGFWIESDEIAPNDADSPSPCRRIALALIRLAYEVAEKVKPQR